MINSSAVFENLSYPNATCSFAKKCDTALLFHRHLEFVCIISGSVEFTINDKTHVLSDGAAALIVPYVPHSYRMLTNECNRFVLVFEPEYIGSLGRLLLKNHPTSPVISAEIMKQEFSPLAETLTNVAYMTDDAKTDNLLYAKAFSGIVTFLDKILSITGLSENKYVNNELYQQILSHCDTCFDDPTFDIHSLAQDLYVSTSCIQQLFNENMHISFRKYIALLRVNKATELLVDSSMSIAEIAMESGFNSIRSFNRIFRAHKDSSPLEYKKLYSKQNLF